MGGGSSGGLKKISYTIFCENKEPNQKLHLKAYEIDTSFGKDLTNLLWKKEILDSNAFLIPGNLKILLKFPSNLRFYNKLLFHFISFWTSWGCPSRRLSINKLLQ